MSKVFDEFKEYLQNLPVLVAPMSSDTVGMFLNITDFIIKGTLFKEMDKVEKPMYYISQTLLSAKTRYPPIEQLGITLVYISKKSQPYSHTH